jgi:hypothetical protein
MRRVAFALTVLGILCVAAGQAQAHYPYYHSVHHHAYYSSAVIRPNVFIAPRVVVQAVVPAPTAICPQPLFYRPVYTCPAYPYYAPVPSAGFYYQSRGLSLGIGW